MTNKTNTTKTKAVATTNTVSAMQQLATKAGTPNVKQWELLKESGMSQHSQAVLYNAIIAVAGKTKIAFATTANTHCTFYTKLNDGSVKKQLINNSTGAVNVGSAYHDKKEFTCWLNNEKPIRNTKSHEAVVKAFNTLLQTANKTWFNNACKANNTTPDKVSAVITKAIK